MRLFNRFSIRQIALVFAVLSLITWQLEWAYSPLQRLINFANLNLVSSQTPEQVLQSARTVIGNSTIQPNDIGTKLSRYGIKTSTTTLKEDTVEIQYGETSVDDPAFIEGYSYLFPTGENGVSPVTTYKLNINSKSAGVFTQLGDSIKIPRNQVVHIGKKSKTELLQQLSENWKSIVSLVNKKDIKNLEKYLDENEINTLKGITKITDLSYKTATKAAISLEQKPEETERRVQVGKITLKQSGCSIVGVVFIYYQKDEMKYTLGNVVPALNALCNKPKAKILSSGVTFLTCKNCWLAPVSKNYSLMSTYSPTVYATGLYGGGYVTSDTKAAVIKLFADAKTKGLSPRISSSYRSYQTQQSLFNAYVKNEMAEGITEAQAIIKANTYSARPGQSEHQLGTTLDVVGCPTTCSFHDSRNTPVYNYLKANVHRFGFVISYPNGSQNYTGYIYEPWHIRFIGVNRATELYNKKYLSKTGYYLYHYLIEKQEY